MTQTPIAANPAADHLTRAYVDLVYASALRRLRGDTHRAADVTQAVMLLMLKKTQAGKLPQEKYMAGRLIKVTGYAVMQANRSAARRTRHEVEASRMMSHESADNQTNADIRDALDKSLLKLNAVDREVIIRRCLQDQSLAEIGQAIGMSENTVGKRIVRAIPKLRTILLRRGISAPTAAIAMILAAELAIKAPAAASVTLSATPVISALAKNLSWKIAMVKIKAATLSALAILILTGAGTAVFMMANQSPSTSTAAIANAAPPPPRPLVWPSTRPTIDVAQVIEGPNDAILKDLLTGLHENQAKLHVIHVHAITSARAYDDNTTTWIDPNVFEGEAWLEAGPSRRYRAKVSHEIMHSWNDGKFGAAKDSSYIETWDGTTARREYQPPFSQPQGESFNSEFLESGLAGADFSMQFSRDKETSSDRTGSHTTFDRNPLAPTVLAKMKLSARRVMLAHGQIAATTQPAIELSVHIPDPRIARTETFWFDPQRGYALLARRNVQSINNREVMNQTYVIESLTEAAPGIFYPSKAQLFWDNVDWVIFTASQVTANEPIDANAFTLNFTPGIDIYDFKNGRGTKRQPATAPH